MGKYYESKKFKALQAEWDKKLADDGFVDIERGHPEQLRKSGALTGKGHVASVALWEAKRVLGVEGVRTVEESVDADHELIAWGSSQKAEYFRLATDVAAQAFRCGLKNRRAFAFALYAQGAGRAATRTALKELGYSLTEREARNYFEDFTRIVKTLLVIEALPSTSS